MLPFAYRGIIQIEVGSNGRLKDIDPELARAIEQQFGPKTGMKPRGIVVLFQLMVLHSKPRLIDSARVQELLNDSRVIPFLNHQVCGLSKAPERKMRADQLIKLLIPQREYMTTEEQGHLLAHFLVSIMPKLFLLTDEGAKKFKGRVIERGFMFGDELCIAIYVEPCRVGREEDIKHTFRALRIFIDHLLNLELRIEELFAVFAQVHKLETALERLSKPQLQLPFQVRLAPEGVQA